MSTQPKPDFTAWFVMQGIVATMRHPNFRELADEQAMRLYQPLSDASRKLRFVTRLATWLPYSWQHTIQEMVTNSGRLKFFCFRKKEIEKAVRKLLASDEITQVIVLGAGLDVLSMRLAPEYSRVNFIEIDREESQLFKAAAFKNAQIELPRNLEFIAGDLRDPLSEILANSKLHNLSARTIWIAEGFLMFVPEDSVVRIFKEIRAESALGSYAVFTTIPHAYPGGLIAQWIQKLYMRKEKCPYAWVVSSDKIKTFVEEQRYTLIDQISYEELQEKHNPKKIQPKKRLIEDIHIAKTSDV
jgi:methyltransferase (TIGR00027 family)